MTPDSRTIWRKSSYSGGTGGDCVELARDKRGLLARDSKRPNGGMLSVADSFLSAVKAGVFDR